MVRSKYFTYLTSFTTISNILFSIANNSHRCGTNLPNKPMCW